MKKGQIYEGIIEEVLFPNKGQIRTEDRTVTIKNGIPGQMVRYQVTKVRKGKAEGRILEVLKHAPMECEPVCRHFSDCGGCTYQTLPYEEQLRLKEQQVKKLLDQAVTGYTYEFQGIKESPRRYGYRNKMEFSFGDSCKDGPLELGMHRLGSFYDIVTVEGCQIADEDFGKILNETLAFFRQREISFFHKMSHTGYLRHLLVRKAANTEEKEILVDLVTTTQPVEEEQGMLEKWKECLLRLPLQGTLTGILHTRNDRPADVVQNEGTKVLYGRDHFYETLLGLRFLITPFSFFQTNSTGAEVLYETARSYIGDTKDQVIFDLYSGTGTIAQILSPVARKVIGVEIVEEAVEAAKENAKLNGLANCDFIAGDVLKVLDTIPEKPDFIVLDPPRDGVHPKALRKIIDYGVERMVYISCKPTSLARDLEMLQACGYRLEKACCVDMFAWSGNVETVVMLSHKKPDSVINVKVEFGEGEGKVPLDNIAKRAAAYKPKERVTYKMIKEYIEVKYGFKVHTAYIAEVKRELGLPMYDAPNAVEELKQPRKHPTAEKVDAIKDALKHYKII